MEEPDAPAGREPDPGAVVVVPVKAFGQAKARLAPTLGPSDRVALARRLAAGVLAAARPLPVVVVCDDDEVAAWARAAGAAVLWSLDGGLNAAVDAALARLEGAGVARAVVAHADLPFPDGLGTLASGGPDEVLIVPDRHGDGTNVLSVPTGRGFSARYGPGSFRAHCAEAGRVGLTVRVVRDEALGWDIDGPDDLRPPPHLGAFSHAAPDDGRPDR